MATTYMESAPLCGFLGYKDVVRFPQIQAEMWGVLLLGTGDIEDKISKDPGTRGFLALAKDKGGKFLQWCNVELPEPSYCPGFSPLFITVST